MFSNVFKLFGTTLYEWSSPRKSYHAGLRARSECFGQMKPVVEREEKERESECVCVWERERERVREWERERTCGLVHFIQHPSSYLEHEAERELTEDQNKTQYFWVARLSRFRIGSVAFSRNSRLQFCFFLWFPGNQGDCHRTKSRLASILLLREVRVATSQILIPGRLGLTCKYGFSSQRSKEI